MKNVDDIIWYFIHVVDGEVVSNSDSRDVGDPLNVIFFYEQETLSLAACARLMSAHDKFHMIFKQRCAGDNPDFFRLSKSLLSYHGFLR